MNSRVFLTFIPLFIALISAFWIVGPSAIGSENGIPNSRISAPESTAVFTIARLVSKSGSPITKNGINAVLFNSEKTCSYVFISHYLRHQIINLSMVYASQQLRRLY